MGRGDVASLLGIAAAKDLDFGQQGCGGGLAELEAEKAGKAQVCCEGDDADVVGKGAGENLVEGVVSDDPVDEVSSSKISHSTGTLVRLTS